MVFVSPSCASALTKWPEGNVELFTLMHCRRWGGWGRQCTLGSWRCCAASRAPPR